MVDDKDREIQSMLRMLMYLRAEMERFDLDAAGACIDSCMEELMREYQSERPSNVVQLAERRRF